MTYKAILAALDAGLNESTERCTASPAVTGDLLQDRFQRHNALAWLAVIGAACHSPSVAPNAAEVRRQGGLVTAGAVDWRPAAGTAVGVKVEAAALGAR